MGGERFDWAWKLRVMIEAEVEGLMRPMLGWASRKVDAA